jgi:hypothetical protein
MIEGATIVGHQNLLFLAASKIVVGQGVTSSFVNKF